ncbi:hypothetical protein N9R07_03355 [Flavobacteriaceae bacterium]|nr:hypothetical protein [Flavobacteriaceae bacterium]
MKIIESKLKTIEDKVGEVLIKHGSDKDFIKKLSETRETNPQSITQMLIDDCLYEETYDKSLFPKILQDEMSEKILGFKPRVYSDKEMERSGIKHINKYELSVLDVMGNILNLFSSSSEKIQMKLLILNICLWEWLIEQDNPYNLLQMNLLKTKFY